MKIEVSGNGAVGADGMAFWYVDDPHPEHSDFFGFKEKFTGLGIIIDTFDNNNEGQHPKVVGVLNDGTREFSHTHNPEDESMEIGDCHLPLRNIGPVFIKLTYKENTLNVLEITSINVRLKQIVVMDTLHVLRLTISIFLATTIWDFLPLLVI